MEIILNNDKFIIESMVYGNNRSYVVAFLIPDWQEVNRNLESLGISSREPDQLVKEPKLIELFQQRIEEINKQFADWEKIRKFILLPKEFSPQKDEVTPTLKLRRSVIERRFQKEIEKMYR